MAGTRAASARRMRCGSVLGGLAAIAATPAAAQAVDDRYWLQASAYFPHADTEVQVSRPGRMGTEIDFEADLDVDKNEALPAIYGGARFGKRWVFAAEYFGLDRNGTRTLSRDLVFDGATYPLNSMVESGMKSDVYRASVGYVFLRNPQAELGAALGLHATDFEFFLDGTTQVGGVTGQRERRKRSFLAPVPTVGAFGTYQPTPKIILNGRVDYLSLKIDDFDGSIINAEASIAYRVWRNVDVGASYRYVDYSFGVNKSEYTADVDYKFSGPVVFLRLGFR